MRLTDLDRARQASPLRQKAAGLLATDEQWLATIENTDLECRFWMPMGANEGQARMRAWTIWSHARANGSSDPAAPVARYGLAVRKMAVAMVAMPELERAERLVA